ncbi:hypothetical protein ACFSO7_15135 [Bacillus sp. CGMCC 1.16607]|uniref:hypothetical protein n=1 Tax=Bacillus sp. CGMCC 1.16607 TaxID=3351842 RepID=UPI0036250F9F
MNKVIKVPLLTYVRIFCIVAAYGIAFGLLTHNFLPEVQLSVILILVVGFFAFKIINYLVVSLEVNENSLVFNGFFKRGIQIPFNQLKEVDLEGPSQFNSNYRLAFFGNGSQNRQVFAKIPLYWFRRSEMTELLIEIQQMNPTVQYEKQVSLYMIGDDKKKLLVNYLLQNIILFGLLIFLIIKYR